MSEVRDRNTLRATLAGFDARQKKIVGGVIAIMIENPHRVREREWITEQFAQVALLACDFEEVSGVEDGRQRIQAYVQENIDPLLNACYLLFEFVGEDLAGRTGLDSSAAVAHALDYFGDSTAD